MTVVHLGIGTWLTLSCYIWYEATKAVDALQFTGLETAEGSEASGTGQDFSPASGHSRSFGQWGSNNSRTSRPRPGPSRLPYHHDCTFTQTLPPVHSGHPVVQVSLKPETFCEWSCC